MELKEIWNKRYREGGDSGRGSYGEHFDFKNDYIQDVIKRFGIKTITDFGCGDGNQIKEISVDRYIGLDISEESIKICQEKYQDDDKKKFEVFSNDLDETFNSQLCTSLDVIYHLIDDHHYNQYMKNLFDKSNDLVLIYSSKFEDEKWEGHVRHRNFDSMVPSDFQMIETCKNKLEDCPADFFLYQKKQKNDLS